MVARAAVLSTVVVVPSLVLAWLAHHGVGAAISVVVIYAAVLLGRSSTMSLVRFSGKLNERNIATSLALTIALAALYSAYACQAISTGDVSAARTMISVLFAMVVLTSITNGLLLRDFSELRRR